MTQPPIDLDMDLSDLSQNDWLGRLDALGDDHGYFEQLGAKHYALFLAGGPRLFVTFETIESIHKLPGAAPRGFDLVARNGWSHLALISDGETWFRDPAVYKFFDRLIDEGFFEGFEQVLFFGAGSGGYAAAAYSVAAPGAQVLALRPQATLDPATTGWDRRFVGQRRLDFNARYGYAPEMLDAAERAFVVYDPGFTPDATHAALFRRPHVTMLHGALAGSRIDAALDTMQITTPLIEAAMAGNLTLASFGRLWRARRDNVAYLRALLKRAEGTGRTGLVRRICSYGIKTRDRALYQRKLDETIRGPAAASAAE